MLLKKLKIKNIRSYKEGEINFPEGSTLLMGDIGSGKTSVLLAIEFALFGLQPSQKGSALIRNNEKDAEVSLEFEIDNQNIIIERKLKRGGKSITQTEASISINNERFEGSVTEIKNKILALLNYPPEFAKKTNDLYKFTVYTPQEEMKQIIQEPSETRLNTLRQVFGIDKYKRINENIDTIAVKIRQEIRIKEIRLGDIDIIKKEIENKKVNLEFFKKKIKEIEAEAEIIKNKKDAKQIEISELEIKINEKRILEKEKEKSEIILANKKEILQRYEIELQTIKNQIIEGKKSSYSKEDETILKNRLATQESLHKQSHKEYIETISIMQSNESQRKETENLKTKITGLMKCPTCLQTVDENYKRVILTKANEEIESLKEQNFIFDKKKQDLSQKIDLIGRQIDNIKTALGEIAINKIRLENLKEKEIKAQEIESQKNMSEKDIIMIKEHIKTILIEIQNFEKYAKSFELKNQELKQIVAQENSFLINKAETNKEIQFIEQHIKDKEEEIKKIQEISKQVNYLKEIEYWISNQFFQLILSTEKKVMLKLREEFSELFTSWFSVLVSDSLTVRLDETFSPIIIQNDYELDYNFLSGGERTAVALAYRLALNQVINSILSRIKTRDIVILDEPTDGFSESQLDKMREVFQQLKIRQLLLVSHEQKIEGFVNHIIRFKKSEGITEVEK